MDKHELFAAFINGTVIAAIIAITNGYFSDRLKNQLTAQSAMLQASLARGTIAYEAAYKREEKIYSEIWPLVREIAMHVELGEYTATDEFREASKEEIREHVKDVSDRLLAVLKKIEAIRPFIPGTLVELLDQFSDAVGQRRRSWEFPAAYTEPMSTAPTIDEIKSLSADIERTMRSRIFALQGDATA